MSAAAMGDGPGGPVPREGLVLVLLLLLLAPGPLVARAQAQPKQQPPHSRRRGLPPPRPSAPLPCSRDRTLLVSLADGKLVALDKHTGARLWTFDSGAPLLSSSIPHQAQLQAAAPPDLADAEAAGVRAARGSVFPGTDGGLYALLSGDDGSPRVEARLPAVLQLPASTHAYARAASQLALTPHPQPKPVRVRLQRLPMGVSDLVNQSPIGTLDGNTLLGSQHTSVFLVDGCSGRLLRRADAAAGSGVPRARQSKRAAQWAASRLLLALCRRRTVYDFDGQLGQLDADAAGQHFAGPAGCRSVQLPRAGRCRVFGPQAVSGAWMSS